MKTKILIIEDNVYHLNVIIKYLKCAYEKYDILTTQDGEEACEIAIKEEPELIISDWELDGSNMDGLQVATYLKKNVKTKHIPIIMATTYTSTEKLAEAMREGVVDYIRKPIDKTELLARVRSSLLLKQLNREEIIKEKSNKLKVLFLGANPSHTSRLNLGKEYKLLSFNLMKIGNAEKNLNFIKKLQSQLIHFCKHFWITNRMWFIFQAMLNLKVFI